MQNMKVFDDSYILLTILPPLRFLLPLPMSCPRRPNTRPKQRPQNAPSNGLPHMRHMLDMTHMPHMLHTSHMLHMPHMPHMSSFPTSLRGVPSI